MNKLFDFLSDEYYQLMIDMTQELHTTEEAESVKKRFAQIDVKKLFDICHEHELDGVVGAYALELGLPLSEEWQTEYDRQKRHLDFLREKSAEICKIMDENGIPMVILKNGGIMSSMIENAAKCPMEDIDSLVRKEDFHKAHEILVKNGFHFKFRSEFEFEILDEAYRDGSTEYYILTPDGEKMWFELAWRAVAGRWIRPDLEPDTNGLMERTYCPEDSKVHILSPEDNLLQVCIHTAKHSYVRAPGLRLHMDVDRIVAHEPIDWDVFLEKVKKTHVKTSTYLSLYIPKVMFGTKVPEQILAELKPKNADKLLNMLAAAELPHPKQNKFNKLGFLRFQTALYDSKKDMLHVLYPGRQWMDERYLCKNGWDRAKSTVVRTLDLVGIRKKKNS